MVTVQHYSDTAFDSSSVWLDALNTADRNGDKEIFFPRGIYHFYTGTKLKHCFVSNNDESVKQIVFYLGCKKDLKIRGDEAKFIFHGRLTPFVLDECQNITISGISIDFAQAFHFEAELIDSDERSSLLLVQDQWNIENGKLLVFNDGLDVINGKIMCTAYHPETGEIAETCGYHIQNRDFICEKENELLRLPVKMDMNLPHLFIRHQARHTPGILIDRSDDTRLENITIHHAEGMAVVGQNSRNIELDHVSVIPSAGRALAVTDDAVHLSECEGRIEIRNCTFRQTLDDAVNVHGMYRKLKKIGDYYLLEACHFQQFGLWHGKPGDILELVKADTMQAYGTVRCKEFLPGTKQLYCLELAEPPPPEFASGDIARIMRSAEMEVVISNNDMANNMSRGILLSGVKRGVIENNKIHSPGNGIYISGDANYWYESGPVRSLEICGNTFDHCAYAQKTALPIKIDPIIPIQTPGFYYHGSVNIHDNLFLINENPLAVSAHSAADLRFEKNAVRTDLPFAGAGELVKADCGNFSLANNILNETVWEIK